MADLLIVDDEAPFRNALRRTLERSGHRVREHHERWDGSGYPHGLAGEAIPISGRITAIADVFDALTSDRVYAPAMPSGEALAEMQAQRSRHFDPYLLDLFLGAPDELAAIRAAHPEPSGA